MAFNNPQLQSTQIQDAITTGKYKAFWVWGLDDPALTPVTNSAISKGIKVACADYTWGTLTEQNVLTASPTCLTTIGQSIGAESTNLELAMNSACTKQVGSGHCNIAFLPGLANYPTDTVRINAMTAYYKGRPNYTFKVMPPGQYDQSDSQAVAQTFFTANKNINVFATFGDQMGAGPRQPRRPALGRQGVLRPAVRDPPLQQARRRIPLLGLAPTRADRSREARRGW